MAALPRLSSLFPLTPSSTAFELFPTPSPEVLTAEEYVEWLAIAHLIYSGPKEAPEEQERVQIILGRLRVNPKLGHAMISFTEENPSPFFDEWTSPFFKKWKGPVNILAIAACCKKNALSQVFRAEGLSLKGIDMELSPAFDAMNRISVTEKEFAEIETLIACPITRRMTLAMFAIFNRNRSLRDRMETLLDSEVENQRMLVYKQKSHSGRGEIRVESVVSFALNSLHGLFDESVLPLLKKTGHVSVISMTINRTDKGLKIDSTTSMLSHSIFYSNFENTEEEAARIKSWIEYCFSAGAYDDVEEQQRIRDGIIAHGKSHYGERAAPVVKANYEVLAKAVAARKEVVLSSLAVSLPINCCSVLAEFFPTAPAFPLISSYPPTHIRF